MDDEDGFSMQQRERPTASAGKDSPVSVSSADSPVRARIAESQLRGETPAPAMPLRPVVPQGEVLENRHDSVKLSEDRPARLRVAQRLETGGTVSPGPSERMEVLRLRLGRPPERKPTVEPSGPSTRRSNADWGPPTTRSEIDAAARDVLRARVLPVEQDASQQSALRLPARVTDPIAAGPAEYRSQDQFDWVQNGDNFRAETIIWPSSPAQEQALPMAFETHSVVEKLIERIREPIPMPGLQVRMVAPEEQPRVEQTRVERHEPEKQASSEPPSKPAAPQIDINAVADKVYQTLMRRERFERERRGLY